MGYGVTFKCKKCKKKYEVLLGAGFAYPYECDQLTADFLAGKYGKEWKALCKNTKNPIIDGEQKLYVCECGYWEESNCKDLYSRTDENELLDNAKLVKKFIHVCPKCGQSMKEEDPYKLIRPLICHKCGEALGSIYSEIMWD